MEHSNMTSTETTVYNVCTGRDPHELECRVNEMLSNGWFLLGGMTVCSVSTASDDLYTTYAQAMVKTVPIVTPSAIPISTPSTSVPP